MAKKTEPIANSDLILKSEVDTSSPALEDCFLFGLTEIAKQRAKLESK